MRLEDLRKVARGDHEDKRNPRSNRCQSIGSQSLEAKRPDDGRGEQYVDTTGVVDHDGDEQMRPHGKITDLQAWVSILATGTKNTEGVP